MTDQDLSNALNTLRGTRLYARALNLVIGVPNDPSLAAHVAFNPQNSSGKDISGLDVEFHVEKSLKPTDPNTCSLKVYNLAELTRKNMSGDHSLTVRLEAGYVGGVSQLYFGEVHSAWTTRDGPDFVTHIESRDTIARPTGVRKTGKIQPGDINGNLVQNFGPRVPLEKAFKEITKVMGIGEGNLLDALKAIPRKQLSQVNGAALMGNAARRMTDICRSAGLEWSVNDGKLQLLNIAESLGGGFNAIKVSATTGMVDDSPAVDSQGNVTCTTLLIPGLAPGILVDIDSLFIQGGYRIEKIRYVGNTRGTQWDAHFDAKKY